VVGAPPGATRDGLHPPRDDISTVLRRTSTPLGDNGTWNALSLEKPQHTNDELWTVPVTPDVGW
jgi:hypothetical protein